MPEELNLFVTSVRTLTIAPSRIYKRFFVSSEEKACRNRMENYFSYRHCSSCVYFIHLFFLSSDPRYVKALNDTSLLHGA